MKLKIKKFQELKAVEVEFPAVIRGRNGAGKSTIKRALAYVLNQQNPETGKVFGNEVYPLHPTIAADIYAEVELEGGGFTLTRRSEPTAQQREKWQNGDQLSVVNVCKVNGVPVKVAEYQQNVDALTKGLDIDSLLKDPKKMRAFLVKLSGMPEYNDQPLKEARAKLQKQKEEITITEAMVRDYQGAAAAKAERRAEAQNPRAKIAIVTAEVEELKKQAEAITAKITDAQPRLTPDEKKHNDEINAQIVQLERATPKVSPMPQLVLLPTIHTSTEVLEREAATLALLKEPKEDAGLVAERDEKWKMVEVYTQRAEAAEKAEPKCAKCAVCKSAADCPSCELVGGSAEEWREKAAKANADANELSELINSKLELDKAEYEAKMERKRDIEKQIAELKAADAAQNSEIEAENAKRRQQYETELAEYQQTHDTEVAKWEAQKSAKLADLRSQLIVPVMVDVTDLKDNRDEIMSAVREKEAHLTALRELERQVTELDAAIETLKANEARKAADLADLRATLVDLTADVERLKAERLQYYHTLEERINDILPDDITVALFRQNISNDDFSECCELSFRGSTAMSGAESLVYRATLSKALQRAAGVELPIIIDEAANVVNADLLAELADTGCTLLIPDADTFTGLTIQPM